MSKCPKCKNNIDYLRTEFLVQEFCDASVGINCQGKPILEYGDSDFGDCVSEKHYCPECDNELFSDNDDAIKFLLNKQNNYNKLLN